MAWQCPQYWWYWGGTTRLVMACHQLCFCAGSCNVCNNLLWYVYNISKKLSTFTKITPIFTHILPLVSCDMVCTFKWHVCWGHCSFLLVAFHLLIVSSIVCYWCPLRLKALPFHCTLLCRRQFFFLGGVVQYWSVTFDSSRFFKFLVRHVPS